MIWRLGFILARARTCVSRVRACANVSKKLKVGIISLDLIMPTDKKGDVMSCFHPVDGALVWLENDEKYKVFYNIDVDQFKMPAGRFNHFVKMPCGKCIGCLDDKAKDWSKRVQLEALYYPGTCYFLTLTYTDDQLFSDPKYMGWIGSNIMDHCDLYTGDVDPDCFINIPQLYKPDLIQFIRDVRYKPPYSPGLRVFGCGEYGPKTQRPHFHLVLMNLNLPSSRNVCKVPGFHSLEFEDDLVPYAPNSPYFISKHILSLWPYGGHTIFPYSYSTGRYVAKYLVKDCLHAQQFDYTLVDGRQKPFLHMSRRPGIGRRFFDEHKERLRELGTVAIASENGAFTTSLPQYYDRLIRGKEYVEDSFVDWFEYKQRHALRGQLYIDSLLSSTDLSLGDYLSRSEEIAISEHKAKKFLL